MIAKPSLGVSVHFPVLPLPARDGRYKLGYATAGIATVALDSVNTEVW